MSDFAGHNRRPLNVFTRKVGKHFYQKRRTRAMVSKRPHLQTRAQKLFKQRQRDTKSPAKQNMLYRMHEQWFFSLDNKQFKALTRDYTENVLQIEIEMQENYDNWLNYLKSLPPNVIKQLATTGGDFIPTEGYAALSRWHDIISNPHRIDKIHQSGLTNPKGDSGTKTIAELALSNDRLGVLKATRDKLAEKLDKGAGSRDTSLLVREMTEVMTQIADYEKRSGPKKTTKLGNLIDEIDDIRKRPSENGKGARHTSFKSRVTIKDVED